MTRDGLVMLGVAFLAGVAVGVEYMQSYAAERGHDTPQGVSGARLIPVAPSLVPAAPMPAEAVTVERRLIILTPPVTCERLSGIEDMGREHISQWGDGDLPPTLPTCVNARHYWQGVYL